MLARRSTRVVTITAEPLSFAAPTPFPLLCGGCAVAAGCAAVATWGAFWGATEAAGRLLAGWLILAAGLATTAALCCGMAGVSSATRGGLTGAVSGAARGCAGGGGCSGSISSSWMRLTDSARPPTCKDQSFIGAFDVKVFSPCCHLLLRQNNRLMTFYLGDVGLKKGRLGCVGRSP
jgi:hypothetical protein